MSTPHAPSPPTRKGQRTRQALLEAAYRQFIHKGYHGASMRGIAAEAGVAVGSIYNHFTGKEDIFKAVILAYHPFTAILPLLAEAEGENLEQLLENATLRFIEVLNQHPGIFNLMFIELVECEGRHLPELVGTFMPEALAFARHLHSMPGQIRPLSPFVLIRTFVAGLFAYYITEVMLKSAKLPGDIGDYRDFLDIYLHGILTPPESSS